VSAISHVLLRDITEIVMGQAPPSADCNKDGRGTVFVKAGEFDERCPLVREWTTNPLKLARSGDILVCVVGATAGKINEAIDCAIGRSVAAVRPDASKLVSPYLYHFLVTQALRLRAKSQGLAQGVITREMLQEIAISLPTLAEQRRIAEVLDRAEGLQAKRRESLVQLDTLTQGLFFDLFGDPMTNRKGFPISQMGDVCDVRDGTHDSPKYVSDGGYLMSTEIAMCGFLIGLEKLSIRTPWIRFLST
jgi:type I restriction enzyme S subunit